MRIACPPQLTNKQEDITQNIEVATVSLPRPRPGLDSEGGSMADISELINMI